MSEWFEADNAPVGQGNTTAKSDVPAERDMLNRLCKETIAYDCGDPKRIQHFIKVHAFAKLIAESEGIDAHTRFVLEAAAYLHDIGIHKAEDLLGDCGGKNQEKLGPGEAAPILERCGFSEADVQRVCFLIAHHHTYTGIDGADWQDPPRGGHAREPLRGRGGRACGTLGARARVQDGGGQGALPPDVPRAPGGHAGRVTIGQRERRPTMYSPSTIPSRREPVVGV